MEKISDLWISTGNKGKLSEFKIFFSKELPNTKVFSISDLPVFSAPPENGTTFLENARIKGKSLKAMKTGHWILAEDSGLEVEGLGKLPGIHSARYAGPKASDGENIAKLLKMMQIRSVADRSARFYCSMVVYTPQGEEWLFEGALNGKIAKNPTGQHGFGYDPVFIPENETKSLAELGSGYKSHHSHRFHACQAFMAKLKQTYPELL